MSSKLFAGWNEPRTSVSQSTSSSRNLLWNREFLVSSALRCCCLPASPRKLTDAQLESVIAHELCHVRRHDNLAAALHMLVEAVFWFHPLVWWIGARLVDERERACDEEVVRLGSDPQIYAESILKVCEFTWSRRRSVRQG